MIAYRGHQSEAGNHIQILCLHLLLIRSIAKLYMLWLSGCIFKWVDILITSVTEYLPTCERIFPLSRLDVVCKLDYTKHWILDKLRSRHDGILNNQEPK